MLIFELSQTRFEFSSAVSVELLLKVQACIWRFLPELVTDQQYLNPVFYSHLSLLLEYRQLLIKRVSSEGTLVFSHQYLFQQLPWSGTAVYFTKIEERKTPTNQPKCQKD